MSAIAVMQPYFLPYLGYFQLMAEVDRFIVFDDVQFIARGWIHRNRILLAGRDHLFTLPVKAAGQHALIYQIELVDELRPRQKILKTIQQSYAHAPYFAQTYPLLESLFLFPTQSLCDFIVHSLRSLAQLFGIRAEICLASERYRQQPLVGAAGELHGAPRIVEICRRERAQRYVNLPGGRGLYEPQQFSEIGVQLQFIQAQAIRYSQQQHDFIPWLSMIDVMMFQSTEQIQALLLRRDLV